MIKNTINNALVLVFLLTILSGFVSAHGATNTFVNEEVISNLSFVVAMDFLPDGKVLLGEITGRILVANSTTSQPNSTPFADLNVTAFRDTGLLTITVDPNFLQNSYYYVFYAHDSGVLRVSRFTANSNWTGTVNGSEFVIWEDDISTFGFHDGGTVVFGPDGKLYISVGDGLNPGIVQSLNNYKGKILRINQDGTIPTDNPFFDGPGPNKDEIWAYGLRNPFKITFDSVTGNMYIADVGTNAFEEINLGVAGANYGWPTCEGPCGTVDVVDPIYIYSHQGRDASITGGFVYRKTQFPSEYQGAYIFGDYAQNWIRKLDLNANGTSVIGVSYIDPPNSSLDDPHVGDIVHFAEGPDGAIYYLDLNFDQQTSQFNDGGLRRLRWIGPGNNPPVPVVTANPTSGEVPLTVMFNGTSSFDPDGNNLTYSWDFGDGNTSTEVSPVHVYSGAGQYTATLTVFDGDETRADSILIVAGNPPVGTILTPAHDSFFSAGDSILITGNATDIEDGVLPDSAFSWTVVFHHDSHVHPAIGPITDTRNITFDIPSSGHDFSGFTRYEIILVVTDSDGIKHTSSVFILPEKVNVSFDSIPTGLTLELDSISKTAPFVHDTLVGFEHTINAKNQLLGNQFYVFESWSDGDLQSHVIFVQNSSTTYMATFSEFNDTEHPSQVSGLVANVVSPTLVDLSWGAATDNIGVDYYKVYRDDVLIASLPALSYSDTSVVQNTSYNYKVSAVDVTGNESLQSNPVQVVTPEQPSVVDLVAYYNFDENQGTVAADFSGNGNEGVLVNGPSWVPGQFNSALSFDRTDDYVDIPHSASFDTITDEITIAMWIKANSFATSDARLLSKSTGIFTPDHYWMLSTASNNGIKLRARLKTNGFTSTLIAPTGTLSTDVWTYVAFTYDGSQMRLYKDGVEVGAMSKTGSIDINNLVGINIGRNPDGYGVFDGVIDEVRVYSRALTEVELLQLALQTDTGDAVPLNEAPVAADDAATTNENTPVTIAVLDNDTDADGDSLAVINVSQPAHGSVLHNGTTVTYTPAQNYHGSDVFTYTIRDSHGSNASATVDITITDNGFTYRGLVAAYTFDAGSGTTIHDVSGVGAPLDLTVSDPNAVSWDNGSLTLHTPTIVASASAATKVIDAVKAANAFSLEVWLTPANDTQDGPARIVSLSQDTNTRNFTLGQGLWGSAPSTVYDMRLRTTATNEDGSPSLTTPAGTLSATVTHVVYTRDTAGVTRLYVDGVERATASAAGNLANWDNSLRLAFGNEMTHNRPWLGTLHLVAIYERALDKAESQQRFENGPTLHSNAVVVFAVNAGGPQYTDMAGTLYEADTLFTGGQTNTKTVDISGTEDDLLYQSERYGDFAYAIPLPNGAYMVTLQFAELSWETVGQRLFDVKIEGENVVLNLDLVLAAGHHTAYDISIPVNVTDEELNLSFHAGIDSAKVNAIVVETAPK